MADNACFRERRPFPNGKACSPLWNDSMLLRRKRRGSPRKRNGNLCILGLLESFFIAFEKQGL